MFVISSMVSSVVLWFSFSWRFLWIRNIVVVFRMRMGCRIVVGK